MQLAVHLDRQHKQAEQIGELSLQLEEFDKYGKIQQRISDFIASLDLRGIITNQVGNGYEMWKQFPVRINDRKIFLVILHTGNKCFGRYLQKCLVKTTGDSDRPLYQRGNLVKQIIID